MSIKKITVDYTKADTRDNALFDGLGMVSANNSSRLLLDYKALYPERYEELINLMFGKEHLGISLLKLEMGADIDSSSGTEPAVKRSRDEQADVTRGAGYVLAADALKVNPDLEVDILYWGIPSWVNNAEDTYAARYQWYKETLDAMYETYGIKAGYITLSQNERGNDPEWIKYAARALKSEKNAPYDYGSIKIVAGEGVCDWEIADRMLEDKELLEAVCVVSSHYTSWITDNVRLLKEKYGKKIWLTEGCSPLCYAKGTYRHDGFKSGMTGINGTLDIAGRITQAITSGMTMYEFQPVISSYYDGVTFYHKQLITANEPWNGSYSLDTGFYMTLHFTKFIKKGWAILQDACFGDGKAGGDGHALTDSTYNYITAVDKHTGDFSIIIVNNTEKPLMYEIEAKNVRRVPVNIWSTKGPSRMNSRNYFENFLKYRGQARPEAGIFKIVAEPYSIITLSTLSV